MPDLLDSAHPSRGSRKVAAPASTGPPQAAFAATAAPRAATPLVVCERVSKWYGPVIGVNQVTLELRPGIVGLVGANGAGKTTLMRLITGQLRPDLGRVEVLGQSAWTGDAKRRIGYCPEIDAFYEEMSGRQFVQTMARLCGYNRAEARRRTQASLEMVGMDERASRIIRGYSKGMRQRTKVAQALVHDPEVLFLDEPLTGTDPVARRDLMDVIHRLAGEGKSVLVSSHVLHEVEALTPNIVLLNRGRLVAEGLVRDIRDLIDKYPHHIVLVADDYRKLAARLLEWEDVEGVKVLAKESGVMVETRAPDAFYRRLPELSLQAGTAIREVYSDDDNLEAVFKYLVNK
jgi:ABC-2 type transport system ATP-binding protein